MKPIIVYIAHPIGGNIEENLKDLVRILRIINLNVHPEKEEAYPAITRHGIINSMYAQYPFEFSNIVPIAPYYANIIALDDNVAEERARGIANDIELIKTGIFKELWLTGNKISNGMHEEIKLFQELHIPVVNYVGKF